MALLKKPISQVGSSMNKPVLELPDVSGLPGDTEPGLRDPNQTGLPPGAPPGNYRGGPVNGPIGNPEKPSEREGSQQPQRPLGKMGGGGKATPSMPNSPTPVAGMTPNPVSPGGIPPTPPSPESFLAPTSGQLLGLEGGLLGGGLGAPGLEQNTPPSDLLLMLAQLLNGNG